MGKQIRKKSKDDNRLPVDESKLQMGNTYSSPPDFYYDIEFTCVDCGIEQTWTAKQQKWWYEEAGGYFFATAIRCRACREIERKRKKHKQDYLQDMHRTYKEPFKRACEPLPGSIVKNR